MTTSARVGGFKIVMAISPITFIKQALDELKKVTWPTRTEIIRLTVSVIAISFGVGIFLGGFDLILTKLMEVVLNR
ncbi:MAG: preprotein translocase subunit SecE [Patescibacteria group bacterium]